MRLPPAVHRPLRTPVAVLLTAAVGACGGGPAPGPPPVPPEPAVSPCPLPLVFAANEMRPRWVRLENTTERPLTVFLDRCLWHTRMADVPPGRARQVRLPGTLVPHGDRELRFHAFDSEAPEYRKTYQVPLGTGPVLRVELSPERAVRRDALPRYRVAEAEGPATERAMVTDSVLGYTSVWGVGGGGVLSWTCQGDQAWLSLGLGRAAGKISLPPVEVRMGLGEWEEVGLWEVVPSVTDAVVAPLEVAAPLTRRLLVADRVSFRVGDRDSTWSAYTFELAGLGPSLDGLPCAASLIGRG